ncbi:MAG: hypothetical protein K0R18_921 [Bacillales bacterium]|nr:hypothetical protein [Bacillales bacterium]
MLGFIDDAREKTVVAEGRAVLVSAQVQATEIEAGVLTDFDEAAIKTLAGVEGDVEVDSIDTDDTTGRVTGFTYENDSYKVVFAAGKYTVTDAE